MFTGIVEKTGKIVHIENDQTNVHFTVETPIAKELKIDQSMSHDGVCLTVVKVDHDKNQYVVTAMQETLDCTNLRTWALGTEVNLERSMRLDGRFDGHVVQGHVDQTAVCEKVEVLDGSWKFYFSYEVKKDFFTVGKGSICVNGVSLTVVDSDPGMFSVAIIPYTFNETNFRNFQKGTVVNIEFDVFGKYVARLFEEYIKARGMENFN